MWLIHRAQKLIIIPISQIRGIWYSQYIISSGLRNFYWSYIPRILLDSLRLDFLPLTMFISPQPILGVENILVVYILQLEDKIYLREIICGGLRTQLWISSHRSYSLSLVRKFHHLTLVKVFRSIPTSLKTLLVPIFPLRGKWYTL